MAHWYFPCRVGGSCLRLHQAHWWEFSCHCGKIIITIQLVGVKGNRKEWKGREGEASVYKNSHFLYLIKYKIKNSSMLQGKVKMWVYVKPMALTYYFCFDFGGKRNIQLSCLWHSFVFHMPLNSWGEKWSHFCYLIIHLWKKEKKKKVRKS